MRPLREARIVLRKAPRRLLLFRIFGIDACHNTTKQKGRSPGLIRSPSVIEHMEQWHGDYSVQRATIKVVGTSNPIICESSALASTQ